VGTGLTSIRFLEWSAGLELVAYTGPWDFEGSASPASMAGLVRGFIGIQGLMQPVLAAPGCYLP
jgi:hypothetical protein